MLAEEGHNKRKAWIECVPDPECSSAPSFWNFLFLLTCPQLCLLRINRPLMDMPVDLSKDIDEHSTIILII